MEPGPAAATQTQGEEAPEVGARLERRMVDWSRNPFAASATLAAVLVAAFAALELALGRVALLASGQAPLQLREDFRIAIVLLLVLAYLPAATTSLTRTARRSARELRPALRGGADDLADAVGRLPAAGLWRAGLLGVAAYPVVQALADRSLPQSFEPLALPSEALVHRLAGLVIGWLLGRFVFTLVVTSRRMSRLGAEGIVVDVLDLDPLAPFARQALRHTLLVLGLLSLFGLLFVDVAAAPGLWQVLAAAVIGMLALAGLCFALPVLGARSAIARAKARERARCNAEIRRRRDALGGDGREIGASGLADVVAYKEHVARVSEWIFDAPILARLGLYLALPLGSWLGGALVERLVGVLLDR